MDCSTIVIVIILIAVAILLYFSFTNKDTSISGGHKVEHDGKTLHIKKFKELKDKLRALNSGWNDEQIRDRAELIVNEFLKSMNYEQAAAKYIDDLIVAYTNSKYLQTSIVDDQTTVIDDLHEFINNQQEDMTLK